MEQASNYKFDLARSRTLDRSEWARSRIHCSFPPALVGRVFDLFSPPLAHRFITAFGGGEAMSQEGQDSSKVCSPAFGHDMRLDQLAMLVLMEMRSGY